MYQKKWKKIGLMFIAPFFVFYLCFNIYPILYTLFLSFTHTKYDGQSVSTFVGLKNYVNLFSDKFFWEAFLNTWQIWLPNIVMQLGLALMFATLFTNIRLKIKGVGFIRAVFYFPNLVTAASIALLFVVLLDWQYGAANQLLYGNNTEKYVNWMSDPNRAKFVVSVIQTWMWFGHSLIILMAGLQSIPITYYEAAEVDGARSFQIFRHVTLPLLSPVLTYVIVTSLIGGMQIFDVPYVISSGPMVRGTSAERGLVTMVGYLYNTAFRFDRYGYASAVSYLLFGITAFFSVFYFKLTSSKNKEV